MENTKEYATLTNLGPQLMVGFQDNMTILVESFYNMELIDELCYEKVTLDEYRLTKSQKAREMWKSIRHTVEISTTFYDKIKTALSTSHPFLVKLMDEEYQHLGSSAGNTHEDQPPAVQSGPAGGLGVGFPDSYQQHQPAAAPGAVAQQQVTAQQPQFPAAQDFSKDFNSHQLFQWTRSKELLHDDDYKIIIDQQINGRVFSELTEDYLNKYGFTLTGQIAIISILKEIKEKKTDTSDTSDDEIFSKWKFFFGTKPKPSIISDNYSEESFEAEDRGSRKPLLKLGKGDKTTKPPIMEPVDIPRNNVVRYYDMTAKKHGVCFIINNIIFKSPKNNREGTERDEYNLIQTWRYLGYRVEVRRNVTAALMINFFKEIENMLENIKQEDPDLAHDSFVCCILSHGEKHSIYGCDEELVTDTEIKKGLGISKTLIEKPKMLFFQTCQSEGAGKHSRMTIDTNDTLYANADLYISHATAYGDVAYRNTVTGSIYIQKLCEILCKNSKQGTIGDLQIALNDEVPQKTYHEKDGIIVRQQCGADNSLRARVHFFMDSKTSKK